MSLSDPVRSQDQPAWRPRRAALAGPFFALILSIGLFSCAGFFQGAGETMVSDQDEAKLGAQFHQTLLNEPQAQKEFPLFVPKNKADEDLQKYVLNTCNKVVASIPEDQKPAYPFTFTIIDKDEENAFAVPGGYVYIYTGILKKFQDESELAGVIGHEITHVTAHHFREQFAKSNILGMGLSVVLGVAGAGDLTYMAADVFYQLTNLKFSRSDEAEADRGGTQILARLGLNPMGIAKYFARAEGQGVPEWLSTHPGPQNRVKTIAEYVNSDPRMQSLAADSLETNRRVEFQNNVAPAIQGG